MYVVAATRLPCFGAHNSVAGAHSNRIETTSLYIIVYVYFRRRLGCLGVGLPNMHFFRMHYGMLLVHSRKRQQARRQARARALSYRELSPPSSSGTLPLHMAMTRRLTRSMLGCQAEVKAYFAALNLHILPLVWLFPLRKGIMGAAWR